MASIILAIKIGSTTTTIYRQGEGLVLREPSMIAVSGVGHNKEVKAIGYEAQRMVGRTSSNVQVVSPVVEDVVRNAELATSMLRGFVRKVCPDKFFKQNVRAVLCVPLGVSLADKKTFQKVCYGAGISDVTIIPAILCTAIGQNINIEGNYGKLIVNIGGGCTNIAVVANNTIVNGISVGIGGTQINTAIEQYVLTKYNLKISPNTADKIRSDVASLVASYSVSSEIDGVDSTTHETKTLTITSGEIFPIMEHFYDKICSAIESIINSCPTDIVNDIYKDGGYFSGKGINYPGTEKYLKKRLNLQPHIPEEVKTDIWGAGKLLDDPLWLKKLVLAN